MNWKLKLFQILKCFDLCEGTWYEFEWESFGITNDEANLIKLEYELWDKENSTSS